MRVPILQREFQRGRRWALRPQRRTEVYQSSDKRSPIGVRRILNQPHLKTDMGLAEQIGFPLEPAVELFQIISMYRRLQFVYNDGLPGASMDRMFGQVVDEPASSTPFLHSLAERGVEFDRTAQKESGGRLMLKTAGTK